MADLTAIRAALVALLDPIVEADRLEIDSGHETSRIDVRAVPAVTEYSDGAGFDLVAINVMVRTGRSVDPSSEARLDRLLEPADPDAVRQRLQADRTLGGLVADVNVARCAGYVVFDADRGDGGDLGSSWLVHCRA